ncbi:MAG: hypothetical protein A3D13_05125 [Planctomycetes bacterium RIFCSPHIGHO2_02_FULL_40_12]|nr:MAG: hypothetical protein A3D13_05125 [Planctomycetes bacterium RIFCSPHIGHO2_02_FULL_40_12]OHC03820.1 MAG: hypothetical protein A3H23_07475 [Planctomycetes bacterium RIFCSPLOWO2_12_FULL_40_19]
MAMKIIKLFLISIVIFSLTSLTITATASDPSYYDFKEQPQKPLQALDDLYKSILYETLDRARETVRMLDDLYKTFIVLITAEYVDDPSILPAATLSKRVFEAMNKKGWHKARLLDATGTPFNPDNNPRDKFEREAIKAMLSGSTYFEKIEKIEGKDHLRAATSVHAVMQGCISCHPDRKFGDLLGAISYSIPLED